MNVDTQRKISSGTSSALKSMTEHCDNCGRGQNPRHTYDPICAGTVWICRYCKHAHLTTMAR